MFDLSDFTAEFLGNVLTDRILSEGIDNYLYVL